MEDQRRVFSTFLTMNASRAHPTEEPCVHLQFHAEAMPHDAPLLRLTRDDVLDALDPDAELVRWLLEQMRTYTCTRQCIVGLVFDRQRVMTYVLRERGIPK